MPYLKNPFKDITQTLVEFQKKLGSLENMFGRPMLWINRISDYPLTGIDIGVYALIIGSIFYKTIANVAACAIVGIVASMVLNLIFQFVLKIVSVCVAKGYLLRNPNGKKGYQLMSWTFLILGGALFFGLLKMAYKTEYVVEVFGKQEIATTKIDKEAIVINYSARRDSAKAYYSRRLTIKDQEVMRHDTSGIYRNYLGHISTRFKTERIETRNARTNLEKERKEEIARIDKLEALALTHADSTNQIIDQNFANNHEESGDFANGLNIAVSVLRIILTILFAFFAIKAIEEDESVKEAAKEAKELLAKKKEAEEIDRKRKHQLALLEIENTKQKAQAEADAIRIAAKASAEKEIMQLKIAYNEKLKKEEEAISQLEIKRLNKEKELVDVKGAAALKEAAIADQLKKSNYLNKNVGPNISTTLPYDNANTSANMPAIDTANVQMLTLTDRGEGDGFVSKKTVTKDANKTDNIPTLTKRPTDVSKKTLTKRVKKKATLAEIKADMEVDYDDNGKIGVWINGRFKTRKQVSTSLASNRNRVSENNEKPAAERTRTPYINVDIFEHALGLLENYKKN